MSQVTVLGAVKCQTGSAQGETLAPNARQLLAIMVAAGPDGLTFDRVADELWPPELPATWEASLRMAFARLRKQLPTGGLTNKARWCRLELPVQAVDIWHLTALADSTGPLLDVDELAGLLAQEAFPLVEISPIIRDAIHHFDLLRTLLLERLIEQNATISPLAAAPLRSFAASRDWDTVLARHVERLTTDAARIARSPLGISVATQLPASLARHRAEPLFGRDDVVERLLALVANEDKPIAFLAAEPKSGRSATLAELGSRLAELGWRIVHLEPSVPAAAFGPFLQALPELRDSLLAAMASGASDDQIRSRCWASILQALDHPGRSTCVIVDDAELLDSNSEEALAFFGRCRTTNPLSIVVTADAADASAEWMNAPQVTLEGLPLDALRDMIAAVHPSSTDLQRLQLSTQISALADGFAGHALQLIRVADPVTLILPPVVASGSKPNPATIDLSEDVLRVAAAASIIRSPISLDALEHVIQGEPHLVLTSVDELLGVGILSETSRPDVFELDPAHQDSDFEAALAAHEVALFSQRAMTLPHRSPIALAADAVRARTLIGDDQVIADLVAAADSLVASQSYREAVTYFQAAEDLGAKLPAEALVSYATSLELIGVDAVLVRERAIALALGNDQPGLALEAALAGLPSAERVDGDAARTKLIESIDPHRLTTADQLKQRLAISRQLLLLSRRDDARREALAARDLAKTVEEEADVWLSLVHIDRWLPTGTQESGFVAARFHSPDDVVDLARRARLKQASAVTALVVGDFVTAAELVAELTDVAEQSEDPLRIWHASLLRSAILTNNLRLDEANRTADEARDFGVSFGVNGAVASRLAQRSNRAVLLGEVANTVGPE